MTNQRFFGPSPFIPSERKMITKVRKSYYGRKNATGRELETVDADGSTYYITRYDSVRDMAKALPEVRFLESTSCFSFGRDRGAHWFECGGSPLQAARWVAKAPIAEVSKWQDKYMREFADFVLQPEKRSRVVNRGMQGDEFDVLAISQGRYDRAWLRHERVAKQSTNGHIVIACNMQVSTFTNMSACHITGAMLRTAIESAQNRGIKVTVVYVATSTSIGWQANHACTVPVQTADVPRVFTAAFYRSIYFGSIMDTGLRSIDIDLGVPMVWNGSDNWKGAVSDEWGDKSVMRTANAVLGREVDRFASGRKAMIISTYETVESAKEWLAKFNANELESAGR